MKLKKGVYGKIFYGFTVFACANVVMFLLCIFGLEDVELACKISGGVGIVCGFVSNKLIENIPYDKDDNYNMQFFFFIILLGLLLIFQGVYFHR